MSVVSAEAYKNTEISQLMNDLRNLLIATDIVALFLDRELRIQRFTPCAGELFKLGPLNQGQPLAQLKHNLDYINLVDDAAKIMDGQPLVERVVGNDGSHWYHVQLRPYLTAENRSDGMLITFSDISARKQAEAALHTSQGQLDALNASLAARMEEHTVQARKLTAALVLAEQKERQRIAQRLHDDLQQLLYSVQIQCSLLSEAVLPTGPPELTELSQSLQATLHQALQLTRQLTLDLSPPILESEGLVEMLRWLAVHMHQLHGLTVKVIAAATTNLPNREMQILFVQLIRELLFNVVKHAGVKVAQIDLSTEKDRLIAHVSDQGKGFDVATVMATAPAAGAGLHSVQVRLALLLGKITIVSQPSKGTRITLSIPF